MNYQNPGQELFSMALNPMSLNDTVTITYTVEYDPECETDPAQDVIQNIAEATVSGTTYTQSILTGLVELPPCQLSVCKLNFDDTVNNPNPSAADCTNPGSLPLASLTFPSNTEKFTIFYQNLSNEALDVGSVEDVLSVNSLTYGGFPISYTYYCNFLPNTPFSPPTPLAQATVQWNNPLWAGIKAIDFAANFPANSTLMCVLTVSTLGSPAPYLPTGCQDSGLPELVNSAFMDLSQGLFFNTSDPHPTPFGQASLYLPLCRNVTVTKDGTTSVGAGQTASFQIIASNNEADPVNGFSVTDQLPPGFIFNAGSAKCTPPGCTVTTSTVGTTTYVTVTFPTIQAGAAPLNQGTLNFSATAPPVVGTFINTATGAFAAASCTPPTPCAPAGFYYLGNLVGALNGQVLAPKLTKAFGLSPVAVGAPTTLTFTITNANGNPSQSGTGFTDTLPSGLFYVPGSYVSTCAGNGVFSSGTQPNMFTFSSGVLNSSTCTVMVQVEAISCGSFLNSQSNITNVTNLDASGVSATLQVPCDAFVEVCKASSSTNPVTGNFTFTSPAFTSAPGNSVTAPVGACSGPIPVAHGSVTITEVPASGSALSGVVASGYTASVLGNRLVSLNLTAGSATVTAVPGGVSSETLATFTNQGAAGQGTAGQLKICKIAGAGVTVGTNFNFKATSTNPSLSQSYTVPAGPSSEGGYCVVDSTTFPVGTSVSVAEVFNPLALPYTVTSVVSPAGTTGTSPIVATLGGGFTEVTFTNTLAIGPFLGSWNTGLSFSDISATVPITQTFPLTSTPPVPFTAAASISSGPAGWLTVSPLQGTTPATITVSVAALPAGTYSGTIAINSTDPNNPLSSTVPVTFVVAPAGQLSNKGSMAQLAFAGNWTTTFTLVNTGTQPVQATLNFFDNNGNPLPVPLAFPQSGTAAGSPVSTATVTVNPGAGQLIQTAGLSGQPTQVGWTQLQATGNLGGFAVFQQAIGASIQEAVVPLEITNPTGFEIWFDNTGGNTTGIALANTVAQGATVPVTIRDDTGAILLSTTTTLAADGHTSFDLASTYAQTSGIRGTVEFDTPVGGQISVLGIQFSPAGAFTTIPALAAASASPASSGSMAQLAFAGGWTTAFTLVNTGTAPVQATLSFFGNNGNPLPVPLVFPQSGTTAAPPAATTTLTVNPGAGQLVQTAGLASQPTQTGWTQLVATGNLGGFSVFQQANGASIQEAVVPLENLNPSAFVIWFDNTGGNATGIALANAVAQGASIPVVIRDDTGAILLSTTTTLSADGHTSFDLASTYAQTSGIRGTVEFDTPAGGQISVLGIEFSPAGAFTTIPALTK
jgi:uncharacterized repeat protein (TIGR01451 family)